MLSSTVRSFPPAARKTRPGYETLCRRRPACKAGTTWGLVRTSLPLNISASADTYCDKYPCYEPKQLPHPSKEACRLHLKLSPTSLQQHQWDPRHQNRHLVSQQTLGGPMQGLLKILHGPTISARIPYAAGIFTSRLRTWSYFL